MEGYTLPSTENVGITILHKPDESRFEMVIDGYTAFVEYVVDGKTLDIIHTIVPQPIGGRGIAAKLVEEAYKFADENGLGYSSTCSYAAIWLKRHRR